MTVNKYPPICMFITKDVFKLLCAKDFIFMLIHMYMYMFIFTYICMYIFAYVFLYE
jgi:hypothetical protein